MQEVLAGDPRWEQVEFLLDCGFASDIESRFQTVNEFGQRLSSILDPIGTKKKDPILADTELGAKMRRVDRNLQVQEYIPAANAVAGQILTHVNSFAGNLKTFTVHFGGMSVNIPLPAGIDPVLDIQHTIIVGLRTRPEARMTKLFIGAKGDRCVLLRAVQIIRGDGGDTPPMAWEEVAWFNPTSPPDQQHVADWVNDIVVTAMEEFARDRLATGAQIG
jgi:hypothetical protein